MSRVRGQTRPLGRSGIFLHSNLDVLLVSITFLHLLSIVWGARKFVELSALERAALSLVQIFLCVTEYQVVIHNFIHNKFFRSGALNATYGLICSVTVLSPFTEQVLEHLNHHKHVNDRVDPHTRTTKDSASTYRFGKDGNAEPLWRYALFSPIRQALEAPEFAGRRDRLRWRIWIEVATAVAFWFIIAVCSWSFMLFSLVVTYCAQVLSSAQNYIEHRGATPGNRMSDSVSCYNWLYNLLWFNNGYHQEHHCRPGVHWSSMKDVRDEMLPREQRRIVAGAFHRFFSGG